ncbi:MAG: NAD(+) synthase [Lachnospiraceae bacterium]|nr:NAD(+) synthase [Lachnospiraceae bacterium]
MKDGWLKAAAVTPEVKVADPFFNAGEIIRASREAAERGAKLIAFPELSLSGYTCGDLFLQETLLKGCLEALERIRKETASIDALIILGLPFEYRGKLFNTAAVLQSGELLGLVPKLNLPNYSEFYEARHFAPGSEECFFIEYEGMEVPFGSRILFETGEGALPEGLSIGVEICEDAWGMVTPAESHAENGASVIVNLSASNALVGKREYRRRLFQMASGRLTAAYVAACAGKGESTGDLVFAGGSIICLNGQILSEAPLFQTSIIYADLDLEIIRSERRRMNTVHGFNPDFYGRCFISFEEADTRPEHPVGRMPFVPGNASLREERCGEILSIQAEGLKKRISHIGAKEAVIGLSGGLDSTLAFLVTLKAFDDLGLERDGIIAVTMPCFGTTDRTYNNAVSLARSCGATLKEINISRSVREHFADIGQAEDCHDVTYENAQARERTQVLMDLANMRGALVVGTGDLSELALGWATYNGDHMSMYGVNAGVPKTLVRHLVGFIADTSEDQALSGVLRDILDTPVSPELLPPSEGGISQKTEELVGPYELHDFFLYYALRYGFRPGKIFRLAEGAFAGEYEPGVIKRWMKVFYRRFFSQQFKRSCLPDGPKVGTVALSPRGDLRMPSDASAELWMKEAEMMANAGETEAS